MKVSELGEFGLIELLAKITRRPGGDRHAARDRLIIDIGDDAAAWRVEPGIQLATVDSLIQGVHFTLETIPWKDLGWKSLAVNLSDIAAMGGVPSYALVSLALPGDTEVEDAVALYEGMAELARESGAVIAGGDTCRSPVVAVTITVLGSSTGENILRRSTARPGDRIAVTGYPGSAAGGFAMLTKGLSFENEAATHLKNAFLRPRPRLAEGQLLARHGVKAAIDISDGIISDLGHVCQASGASARIESARLPLHSALTANFGDRAIEMALGGGEDYELLFTAPAETIERVGKEISCPVTIIGEITAGRPGEVEVFDSEGSPVTVRRAGWEHFRTG